ncbi:branched-chain amino acid ABC transporter permease [Tepidibacillus fermentans]|uniref:Amino acid/amide ABC transporter membrane protein 2 (HAAT family) n=1 Tax=Tepidibacillus fermentans TaxID=1281767 RepID=A0A4R3KIG6_9BACI|nr:branched-chain amino acid ABC transporter permease [Tepidibacillus fermentans]TCS83159.1 amino acid/amide ABC transporter membrane protein 2 (HAAT family) [Tepidibacillus fermentans]
MMRKNKNFIIGVLISLFIYLVIQVLISMGILSDFWISTIILISINIILGVSLNLINGFTGQFSIGHAGFMSIGAYLSAIMTLDFNLPFPLALLVGGIAATMAGFLIGVPSLRLKGDYLAIATLGFGEIIRIIWLNTEYVGGASGLSGIPALTNWTWVFIWMMITILVVNNFVNSTHGRACISIRENEIAAEAMGIHTTKYKVIAFMIGSFFAGIAGGLSAHMFYIINPNSFNFMKSFEILVIVVLGGLGSTSGSIIGAIVLTMIFTLLQDYPEIRMIIYSLLLILMMIFRPKGLMGTREFSFQLKKRGEQYGKHTSA